jgi:hypothetical protein
MVNWLASLVSWVGKDGSTSWQSASETKTAQIKLVYEDINHPDRIVILM